MKKPFNEYLKDNPHLYDMFVHIAKKAKREGFKTLGSKAIFEQIRITTQTKGKDGYRINNYYTRDFALKMEREYPEFKGFFRTKIY